jgi:hypothetical protein
MVDKKKNTNVYFGKLIRQCPALQEKQISTCFKGAMVQQQNVILKDRPSVYLPWRRV